MRLNIVAAAVGLGLKNFAALGVSNGDLSIGNRGSGGIGYSTAYVAKRGLSEYVRGGNHADCKAGNRRYQHIHAFHSILQTNQFTVPAVHHPMRYPVSRMRAIFGTDP